MCTPPAPGGVDLGTVDLATQAPIVGTVTRRGAPAPGAYVRLLDANGEFVAEVVSSATGQFRFFAAPGTWTVRVLHPSGSAEVAVTAATGVVTETAVALPTG